MKCQIIYSFQAVKYFFWVAVWLFTQFALIVILVLALHPTEGCTSSKKILKPDNFRLFGLVALCSTTCYEIKCKIDSKAGCLHVTSHI